MFVDVYPLKWTQQTQGAEPNPLNKNRPSGHMGLTGCYHNFGAETLLSISVYVLAWRSRTGIGYQQKKVKNRVNDVQNTTFYV